MIGIDIIHAQELLIFKKLSDNIALHAKQLVFKYSNRLLKSVGEMILSLLIARLSTDI